MRRGLLLISVITTAWLPCLGFGASPPLNLDYSTAVAAKPSTNPQIPAKPTGRMMTLEEAIMLALRYNTDVQSAEIQRITDKWALKSAYYQFEPQFSITGNTQKYTSTGVSGVTSQRELTPQVNLETPIGTQVNLSHSYATYAGISAPSSTLTITQPLLQGASYQIVTSGLQDAKDQEIINKLTLKNAVITTVVSVIKAYRGLQQSLYQVQTSQLAVKNDQQTLRQDEILIKAGQQAPSTIVEAQSQLAGDKFSLEQAQNDVAQNKLSLLNTIGLDPETLFQVPSTILITKAPLPTLQQAEAIAFKNNITYKTALIGLRVARRSVQQAIDEGRWQLDFQMSSTRTKTEAVTVSANSMGNGDGDSGNGGGTGGGGSGNNGNCQFPNSPWCNNPFPPGTTINTTLQANTNWGFTLNIPIDDINLKSSIVSAKVSYRQQLLAFQQERRQLITQLLNDIQTINSNYEQLLQAQQALQFQQQNLDQTNQQLKYGIVSTFQVNQTVTNLITSRANLVSTQIAYANSLTDFSQDLGVTLDDWHIKVRD